MRLLEEGIHELQVDGEVRIHIKNGKAYVEPLSACFIARNVTPVFKHDCDKCLFLDTYNHENKDYDLYYCNQSEIPTVIARYGNEGSDYLSGRGSEHMPLKVAKHFAIKRGHYDDGDLYRKHGWGLK